MRAIISDTSGHLILRLKVLGQQFSEQTHFIDSPKNRGALRAIQNKINDDIRSGVFEYGTYFPHSKNVLLLNAIKSKFVSPGSRHLPTARHFLRNEYHGQMEYPEPRIMLHMMSCIGDVKVDEIKGLHLLNLASSLKSIIGVRKSQLIPALLFALDLLDKAALAYVFDRPFRLVRFAQSQARRPLSHQDILHIARYIPVKYHDLFLCQYYMGITSRELVDLEWSQYDVATSTFELGSRSIYVDPYSRRLLFHLNKMSGNSRYVFCDRKGQKQTLNHSWLNNTCWRDACEGSGHGALKISELRRASVVYLFESGLSVEQISNQTQLLYRPYINKILSMFILM